MYFMDDWRPLALWRAINIINEGRSQIRDYQIRACSAEKSHCCPGVYHTFKACLKSKYRYSYICVLEISYNLILTLKMYIKFN